MLEGPLQDEQAVREALSSDWAVAPSSKARVSVSQAKARQVSVVAVEAFASD